MQTCHQLGLMERIAEGTAAVQVGRACESPPGFGTPVKNITSKTVGSSTCKAARSRNLLWQVQTGGSD